MSSIKRDRKDDRPAGWDKRYMTARPYSGPGVSFDELLGKPGAGDRISTRGGKTTTSSTSRARMTITDKSTGKKLPRRGGY